MMKLKRQRQRIMMRAILCLQTHLLRDPSSGGMAARAQQHHTYKGRR